MLNSKQRATLRAIANRTEAVFQIGKGGLGENIIKDLDAALEAKELVKISVLRNADGNKRNFAERLEKALKCETVAVIGNKIILYRRSNREGIPHIEL